MCIRDRRGLPQVRDHDHVVAHLDLVAAARDQDLMADNVIVVTLEHGLHDLRDILDLSLIHICSAHE